MTPHRAYSRLVVKTVDEAQRIIEGIATSATPDRMGDVVEPDGAQFTLPIPLLRQHNSREPIGHVTKATRTKDGWEIIAKIARTDLPGLLKDRLDLAWQEIVMGLVRGLSIGFKSIEEAYDKQTGGFHFLKWEWLELSAVTIPANEDASIQTIKAYDVGGSALAPRARVVTLTPGAAGFPARPPRESSTMKTIAERKAAFLADQTAKRAKMTALMADDSQTLDAAQQEEFDTLAQEVDSIDKHLARLDTIEQFEVRTATPVRGGDPVDASRSRGGIVQVIDPLPKGIRMARYGICLAMAKGDLSAAERIAKHRYPDEVGIHTVLKAAVEAGTTTDPSWAGNLVVYQQFQGDFIEYLRPKTVLGQFGTGNIPSLRRIPFLVQIKGQTSGGSGYWVGQGMPKPVTKFDFNNVTHSFAKVANIAVLTEELARFSSPSAEALVRDALAGALIERLDIDFVDPAHAAIANVTPASITNGIAPLTSAGNTAANVRTDIATFMAPFIAAKIPPSSLVWIMSSTTALNLSLLQTPLSTPEFPGVVPTGGTFHGIPVIVSDYLVNLGSPTGNMVVLVAAQEIYISDDGQVMIDVSREASIEMSDAPTNSVATGSPTAPVATSLVSLWQTDSIGLRAERVINWSKRRSAAAQWMANVNWGG